MVKYLNFAIAQLSIYFTKISHADRGTIYMKHIKRDLRLEACTGSDPLGGFGVGADAKIQLYRIWSCYISNEMESRM